MAIHLLPDPVTVGETARAWVLILHTLLSGGTWSTVREGPYTEERCNEAAEAYEAMARLSINEERPGGDADMVWKAIAVCIPAPNR